MKYLEHFSEQTRLRGKWHVKAEHVLRFVPIYSNDGSKLTLEGLVRSSFKKNNAYNVTVSLDKKGVLESWCQCVKGLGAECSHRATLILFGTTFPLSCTSGPNQWVRKPQTASECLPHVKSVEELGFFRHQKKMKFVDSQGATVDKLNYNPGLKEFATSLSDACPTSGLNFFLAPEPQLQDVPLHRWSKVVLHTAIGQDPKMTLQHLINMMLMTDMESEALAKATQGQFQSVLYCAVREYRFTSTKFCMILSKQTIICQGVTSTTRKNKNVVSRDSIFADLLFPANRLDKLSQIEFGKTHEATARKDFQDQNLLKVECTGIWLDSTGFLGASPDGLVGNDAVVEIKCLWTIRRENVTNYLSVQQASAHPTKFKICQNMSYLKINKTDVIFNTKHTYWHQIQAQMHFTGRTKCYFIAWTSVKPIWHILVERDESYKASIGYLQDIWQLHYFPYVMKRIHSDKRVVKADENVAVGST